jgi:hypothetical protein
VKIPVLHRENKPDARRFPPTETTLAVPSILAVHSTGGADEALAANLIAALELHEGERLERLYLFDAVERRDTTFSLAFVVKRVGEDRLEMAAIGGRTVGNAAPAHDFFRRARFPESVLPLILAEFIDRCGVEGAVYREIPLAGKGDSREQVAELAAALAVAGSEPPVPRDG